MRNIVLLMIGILLIGVNALAGGDLVVNGSVGIGTTANLGRAINIDVIDKYALYFNVRNVGTGLTPLKFGASIEWGTIDNLIYAGIDSQIFFNGPDDTSNYNWALTAPARIRSLNSNVFLGRNKTADGGIITIPSNSWMTNTYISTEKRHSNERGFDISRYHQLYISSAYNDDGQGSQDISFTNLEQIKIDNFALSTHMKAAYLTGLKIDQQTGASIANYGIVLNGDGAGADIVFGPNQNASIFSNAGELYAKDQAGNVTQISPHDPETGEWIYFSKNVKTGKVVRVDMEKLVKAVEKLTGEKFIVEIPDK